MLVWAAPAQARGDYGKDWQHCVQVVANLRAEQPTKPLVVLLGGSAARECTVSDTSWARQIKRRSGYDVLTYNLGSKHRTYSQDLEFVKRLPRGRTLVYIGINLGRFCIAPASATISLPSPHPEPVHRHQHVYSRDRILTAATKHAYVSYWMESRYPLFRANYEGELKILEKIVKTCRRRGLHVALVDLPRDLPAIGDAFDVPVSRYHKGCAALARSSGIPWLHFVAACDFVDGDFFDIYHLVEPGRVKFQSILSSKTITLLERYGMTSSSSSASPSPSASASPRSTSAAGSSRTSSLVLAIACGAALVGVGAGVWRARLPR